MRQDSCKRKNVRGSSRYHASGEKPADLETGGDSAAGGVPRNVRGENSIMHQRYIRDFMDSRMHGIRGPGVLLLRSRPGKVSRKGKASLPEPDHGVLQADCWSMESRYAAWMNSQAERPMNPLVILRPERRQRK